MLAVILGEIMAVTLGNILYVFLSVPILMILKIITKKQVSLFVVIFLSLLMGFLFCKHAILESENVYSIPESKVVLVGQVSEIKESSYGWNVYLVDANILEDDHFKTMDIGTNNLNNLDTGIKCRRILVTLEEPKVEMGNGESELVIGNIVEVYGQLKHFEVARNQGNFDSKKYYKSLGIYAKVESQELVLVNDKKDLLRHWLDELKEMLVDKLDRICNEKHTAIYKAMLMGDKNEIDSEIKDLYSLTGISHVLAISGLHISFIGLFVYSLLRKRFGFSLSASISIIIVVSFGILSGMGIATVRAIVMFGLKLLGEVLGRIYDYVTAISMSAIFLILENPFVIFNSGFQMSFVAIIAITLVWPVIENILSVKGFWKSIATGLTISMLMNPIIAFNYFQLPTYSFALNLVVVPLMSVVLVSGIIGVGVSFISLWLGKLCIFPGGLILDLYTFLCEIVSGLPLSNVIVGKPAIWVMALYYVLFITFIFIANYFRKTKNNELRKLEKNIPKKGINLDQRNQTKLKVRKINFRFGIITVIVCFGLNLIIYNPLRTILNGKNVEVTFLDVGQGDGIFIRTDNGTTVIIDGGSSSVDSVGKYRIIPFLKSKGIKYIDYAIVTHTDLDHISGLIEMMEDSDVGVKIRNIVLPNIGLKDEAYLELVDLAYQNDVNVLYISKGNSLRLGQVEFECLYPLSNILADDKNDSSTVLSVTYGSFSMLLTGDISTSPEVDIMNSLSPRYTILKIPHHGSKYSTSEEFLAKVRPLCSIISVGKNNMYGHPSDEVLDRLADINSMVLRTDYSGGITVKVNDGGKKVTVEGYVEEE